MWKKILIALGILVALILALFAVGAWYLNPSAEKVLDFMAKNPERSAILLVHDDSVIASRSPDVVIPLASTVKIMIAIEYAEQAAAGLLDPDEPVDMQSLEVFHVPNTDGGAHTAWLKAVEHKVQNGAVPVREVVKGMIQFSSNANTEWLMAKLGLDRINARVDSLGLTQHTPVYYIVSALFVGKEAFPGLKGKALAGALRQMEMEKYIEETLAIHEKLLADPSYKTQLSNLGFPVQKAWTDKLPASTATEYAGIARRLNRKDFDPAVQPLLDEVMETMMENKQFAQRFRHAGKKGGSTMFLLTKALYATDKEGHTTEVAYLLHDLSPLVMLRLEGSIKAFEWNLLTQEEFRDKVQHRLGG